MRLWWVSMSLFMELEGELGLVIFSCCSSNGIPHWLMRLRRRSQGNPPVPGIAYPWLVVLLLLLLFICSLAKAVSDVNDAMML